MTPAQQNNTGGRYEVAFGTMSLIEFIKPASLSSASVGRDKYKEESWPLKNTLMKDDG